MLLVFDRDMGRINEHVYSDELAVNVINFKSEWNRFQIESFGLFGCRIVVVV